jgi:hypothetical protein
MKLDLYIYVLVEEVYGAKLAARQKSAEIASHIKRDCGIGPTYGP